MQHYAVISSSAGYVPRAQSPDAVVRMARQIAKRQGVVNPENTFASVKRFIGRKMNEVAEESKQVPYKVRGAATPRTPWGQVS